MEKGISLYELSSTYSQLPAQLESQVSQEELNEYLDSLDIQIQEKVENVFAYSRNLSLYGDAIDTEIKRLQDLKKSYINRSEALKNYISYCLIKNGLTDGVDTDIARFSFRKSESTEIVDESQIPEEYMVTKTSVQPDKMAIKEAIKSGVFVPGAIIKENQNLQIK